MRILQDRTKNGTIVRDHDIAHQKLLGRLEHHLQMSKIKLSVSRNENITLKKRVQDLRRDKLLHLQILNDLVSTHICLCIIIIILLLLLLLLLLYFYNIIALY